MRLSPLYSGVYFYCLSFERIKYKMNHTNRNRVLGKVAGTALIAFTLLGGIAFPQGRAAATSLSAGKSGTGQVATSPAVPSDDSISLISPSTLTIPESDDYATQVLGDPWDMNNIEDIDMPLRFTAPTVSNGIWSATTTGSAQNAEQEVFFQYQNMQDVYNYVGEKSGANYPIQTGRYTHLRFRMYAQSAGPGAQTMVYWFLHPGDPAPCGDCSLPTFIHVEPGWHIYDVNLNAEPARWAQKGSVAGLRLDAPWNAFGNNIQFDWARLTPDAGTPVNIGWRTSGSSANVNLYLSTSADPQTANELQIASVPASQQSYNWTSTGMAPGVYYIHAQFGTAWDSSGPLTVNTAPVLQIDAPGPLSGEDFAYAQLGYGWDTSNANQFRLTEHVRNLTFGANYLEGSSSGLVGGHSDPSVTWTRANQGLAAADTSRYKYFNVKLWLQAPVEAPTSPWNAGPRFTYGPDADANHVQQTLAPIAPYNRWLPLTYDMSAVPATAPAVGFGAGWSGTMALLRFDPHEEDDATGTVYDLPFFRMGGAHLTSQPIAGAATLVRWHKYQGAGTVSLFYDTDNQGFDGQPIPGASAIPVDQGFFGWNTASLPNGANYYVYAVASDGLNTSMAYSLLPVNINHASPSTIFTDVPTNNPFANEINNLAVRGIINGYPQFDTTVLFKPGATASRAQLSKMVVLGAGGPIVNLPISSFADMPTDSPLFSYIETAVLRGIVSGYPCGGPGEPCNSDNRPYFRPNRNITRAQTAKMIIISRGWIAVTTGSPTFADVPASSPLYGYVEAAAQRGIIGGYACGGAGEPCDASNHPYFRPNNDVTRGQISKMLSGALGRLPGAPNASPTK